MASPRVCLASRSPRRRELLRQIGVRFEVVAADVEEVWQAGEPPSAYVRRLALAKARAGWLAAGRARGLPVLGADTAVVLDEVVLGKPADRAEALEMLARLAGRVHEVVTAVAVVAPQEDLRLSLSRVWLRPLSEAERRAYWATGEGADKAGAYAIQGLAGAFVARLEGSYSGVVGLPLFETAELLGACTGFGIGEGLERG